MHKTEWEESIKSAINLEYFNLMKQITDFLGPLLLTWFNFNPSMDK